ncbi:DUF4180 domain-containing protein [Tumebacillus lipolyticus]|uniref:DUF4180 domain-containing protein n=1 Tax=Tumebacillus lipolyticus TaxID=1280370 RepID=A0ABW4ZUV9_9BACL
MEIEVNRRGDSEVAVISSDSIVIAGLQDALDVMVNLRYSGYEKMVLRKEHLLDDFYELRTGIAGEILQKYTNYGMKIAIVGDFSGYNSKSLNDFIYECNRGNRVFFKATEAEALDALHGVA